jgi:hypothetical protein
LTVSAFFQLVVIRQYPQFDPGLERLISHRSLPDIQVLPFRILQAFSHGGMASKKPTECIQDFSHENILACMRVKFSPP